MLLLLACADAPDAPVLGDPTPWAYEEPAATDADPLPADALDAALGEVVDALRRIDPERPYLAYSAALAELPEGCPARSDHNNQDYDEGDCDSPDGAYYGYELSLGLYDMTLQYAGGTWHRAYQWMTGGSLVRTPDGAELQSLGDCSYRDYDDLDGARAWDIYLWGDFSADTGDDWLAEGLGVELYGAIRDGDAGRTVTWSGGVTRLDGALSAFDMDALTLDDTVCTSEPSGSLRLWDTAGLWYDVAWGECDGCAELSVGGTPVGTACADWASLLTWTERPWE